MPDGLFLLDKAPGASSNQALQAAKKLLHAKKAGHLGSLDPMATGLLPISLGEGTKFSQFLLEADKEYFVVLRLGVCTSTGDTEGEVIETRPVAVQEKDIGPVLARLTGEQEQVPPMHSAVKYKGKALYHWARMGQEVPRQPRKITIYALEYLGLEKDLLKLRVASSKGTYIRVLALDIGKALGCGAHVAELRRSKCGPFRVEDAMTLEALALLPPEARLDRILPVETMASHLPEIILAQELLYHLRQGQEVWQPKVRERGMVRLRSEDLGFLGIGEVLADGRIAPRRLVRLGASRKQAIK